MATGLISLALGATWAAGTVVASFLILSPLDLVHLCLLEVLREVNLRPQASHCLSTEGSLAALATSQSLSRLAAQRVTDPSVTLALKVGPGLRDLQKRGRRILAERNAKKAEENTWIGRMIAAENINEMKALIKSHDSV